MNRDLATKAKCVVVGAMLCVVVVWLWGLSTTGPGPAAAAVPTPTPTVLPRRAYDPPAPPGMTLPAERSSIHVAAPGGYPRIVKLWGGYDATVGLDFYAQYDVLINAGAFTSAQLDDLRSLNPGLIPIYSGIGTYDEDSGPLGSQWISAPRSSWQFECFLRGTGDQVLRVYEWNHGMFNMSNDTCTDAIVDYLVSQFDPQVYDGVFFDRINQEITPILSGIDLDHDGHVDNAGTVNQLYYQGTQRFLNQVQAALSALLGREAIILGNDAPLHYTSQLNGREYEMQVRDILDGKQDWMSFRYNYEQWMHASRQPRLTMVMANPPAWMREKYGLAPYTKMRGAALTESAAYYRRMRFGLTTALLEGGTYSFEFGDTWHGNAWWYDEFDGAGLGKGYLGQPVGDAYFAAGPLATSNGVRNPSFEVSALPDWTLHIQNGAQAALDNPAIPFAPGATRAARVAILSSAHIDDVRLQQADLALLAGQQYTVSFWGKAPQPHWRVKVRLHAPGNPGITYGLDNAIEMGTTWQQYWLPFTASSTAANATLSLAVGSGAPGEVWIDLVRLQQGVLPNVFRRDFEHGLVLCNTTHERQTVPLGGVYYRIDGTQAPLVKILIDDTRIASDAFAKIGGWGVLEGTYDDWGDTANYALTTGDPDGFLSKAIWRPTISYPDRYDVYAWLAPRDACTDIAHYTIQHSGGLSPVAVSQQVSEPTWVYLGTYPFAAGTDNCVTLTNYTQASRVVADVVKFESRTRYNDGAPVTSVTLAPQDGIVLLNDPPFDLPFHLFFPIIANDGR